MEDRELVRRLLEKDEEAERYFFQTHRDRLCKACFYILGYQDPEAEDVAQEAFMKALQKLPEFEFRSSLSHWLLRIGINLCYDRIRQRQRLVIRLTEELDGLSAPHSMEIERQRKEDVGKHKVLEVLETQKKLLGEPCRELIRLRDEEEKSYAAISEELKIPIGTVMSRLSRCKEALKDLVVRAMREEANA